jgi:rRNA maturation endonuclease Nob1
MGLETLLLAIALLGLGVAGIAIKILVKKDGEFSGTCASNNPLLSDDSGSCSICGARPQDQCRKEDVTEATA